MNTNQRDHQLRDPIDDQNPSRNHRNPPRGRRSEEESFNSETTSNSHNPNTRSKIEHQASIKFKNAVTDFKNTSCCLFVTHGLIIGLVTLSLTSIARSMHAETQLCYFLAPISYLIFLIYSFFVAISSVLSMFCVGSATTAIIYLSKLRAAYLGMLVLGFLIIIFNFLPSSFCYSQRGRVGVWPVIWGMFSILEAFVMTFYLRWLMLEIEDRYFSDNVSEQESTRNVSLRGLRNDFIGFELQTGNGGDDESQSTGFSFDEGKKERKSSQDDDSCLQNIDTNDESIIKGSEGSNED